MSQNITLNSTNYTGITKLRVKKTGSSDYAEFVDTSDADASASDIASGKTAYVNGSKVTGSHSCSGGITPTGSISITENGTVDVTNYAQAIVNVASGSSGGFALRGTLAGGTDFQNSGAQYFYSASSYTGNELPSITVPQYESGVMVILFDGADQGASSVNGVQRIVYIYNTGKAMVFQQGYRSGNSVQAAALQPQARTSADTSLFEIHSGNSYSTYIPSTAQTMKVYECELSSEIASLILNQYTSS